MNFKHLIWNLSKPEIDTVNVLINMVDTYDKLDIGKDSIDYNLPIYMLELTYHDLAACLGFSSLDEKTISDITIILNNLTKIQASIYYNNDDDSERFVDHSTLIMKYSLMSTKINSKRDLNKRFVLMLSTSIIKVLRENKDVFKKLYTHDRYNLKSKYSTLLYDVLSKQTKGSNIITIDYSLDEFSKIMNFELEETSNFDSWTKINSNILNRASKEINSKSNMYLNYDKKKEKIMESNRIQTSGIRFEVSLAPESEAQDEYFSEDELMEKKISYYIEREITKKIEKLKKFNDLKVKNEDNYRFSERQKLIKRHDEFKSKVKIQELVNWIKYNNSGTHGLVCFLDIDDNAVVTVNSNHKLLNIENDKLISNDAIETYEILEKFLNNNGLYDLIDVGNRKTYSISYSKG